jgi:hypothetical protein
MARRNDMARRRQRPRLDIMIGNGYAELAVHYLARSNEEMEKARNYAEQGGLSPESFDSMVRSMPLWLMVDKTLATRH